MSGTVVLLVVVRLCIVLHLLVCTVLCEEGSVQDRIRVDVVGRD